VILMAIGFIVYFYWDVLVCLLLVATCHVMNQALKLYEATASHRSAVQCSMRACAEVGVAKFTWGASCQMDRGNGSQWAEAKNGRCGPTGDSG